MFCSAAPYADMLFTYVILFKMTWVVENEFLNKVVIFVFFAHKKYSCRFIKLQLNHWCHMDYFDDVLTMFMDLDHVRILASMSGSKSSWNSSKISQFVFRRWTKVLQVWNDLRVSNKLQNFHFWVNYSFKEFNKSYWLIQDRLTHPLRKCSKRWSWPSLHTTANLTAWETHTDRRQISINWNDW